MPWKLGKRDGEIVVIRERDNKVVGRHKSRKKAAAQLRALYAIEKARSFGGDRSAAGRYAAEQRWKGHVKAEPAGGGTGPKRTVEEKLRNGPLNLSFGRDANGLPKVGSFDELCARYGVKPNAAKKADLKPLLDYFMAKYGKYGLEMVFPALLQKKIKGDQVDALPIILAGAQALEDVLDNLDLEGIGEAIARAREADERIKPIEGSTPAPEGMSKRQNLPVVKFTMNQNPNGDFTWNGEGQDQLRLHAAAISDSTMSALWMLASAKNKQAGSEEEMVYQTSTLFSQQDDTALGMSDENFRTAQMRRAYGTMVHEWGHFLDYRLGPKGDKVGDLYQRKRAREDAGTPTFDQSATGYGRSNPNESVAETFAAWFLFSQARFPKERGDAITRTTQRVQQGNEQMAGPLLTRAEIIKQMVRSSIAVTPNNLPLNHPVTLFTIYPFLNKIGELRDAFAKARSFGGDRSEAGRYAANIRWQNERKANAVADENQIVRTTAQKFKQGPMLQHGLDAEGLPRMLTADEAKNAYGVFVTDFTAELKRRGINLSSDKGLTNLNDPKTRGIVQALADIGDQFGGILAGTGFKVSVADDPLSPAAGEVYADGKIMSINPMRIEKLMKAATGLVMRMFPTEVLAEGDEALQKIAYGVVVHEFGHLLDNLAAAKVPPSERRLYMPHNVTEAEARQQGDHFRWASLSYIGAEGQTKFVSQIDDAPMGSANWAQQYSTWNPAEQHAEAFSMWWLFSGYKGKRAEIKEMKRSFKDRNSDRSVKASLEFLKAAMISDTPEALIQMPVMRTWALMAVMEDTVEKAKSFGGDRSAAGRYAAEQRWAGHTKKGDAKGNSGSDPSDEVTKIKNRLKALNTVLQRFGAELAVAGSLELLTSPFMRGESKTGLHDPVDIPDEVKKAADEIQRLGTRLLELADEKIVADGVVSQEQVDAANAEFTAQQTAMRLSRGAFHAILNGQADVTVSVNGVEARFRSTPRLQALVADYQDAVGELEALVRMSQNPDGDAVFSSEVKDAKKALREAAYYLGQEFNDWYFRQTVGKPEMYKNSTTEEARSVQQARFGALKELLGSDHFGMTVEEAKAGGHLTMGYIPERTMERDNPPSRSNMQEFFASTMTLLPREAVQTMQGTKVVVQGEQDGFYYYNNKLNLVQVGQEILDLKTENKLGPDTRGALGHEIVHAISYADVATRALEQGALSNVRGLRPKDGYYGLLPIGGALNTGDGSFVVDDLMDAYSGRVYQFGEYTWRGGGSFRGKSVYDATEMLSTGLEYLIGSGRMREGYDPYVAGLAAGWMAMMTARRKGAA